MPVPVPAELLILAVGARVSAGDLPLVAAVLAFEAVAVLGNGCPVPGGTRAWECRGQTARPARWAQPARLGRATSPIERRGRVALAVGRATPGLRTLTVIAAGGSGLSRGRALPALIADSTVFLQLHLFLGYFLGSAALHVLHAAIGPALAVLAVLVAGGIVFWGLPAGQAPRD